MRFFIKICLTDVCVKKFITNSWLKFKIQCGICISKPVRNIVNGYLLTNFSVLIRKYAVSWDVC